MELIRLLIFAGLACAVVWIVAEFVVDYAQTAGTPWQRALTASEESATILWSKFVMLCGLASSGLVSLADYLGDPNLASAIQAALKPQYVAPFIVFVAAITIFARKRTLPKG